MLLSAQARSEATWRIVAGSSVLSPMRSDQDSRVLTSTALAQGAGAGTGQSASLPFAGSLALAQGTGTGTGQAMTPTYQPGNQLTVGDAAVWLRGDMITEVSGRADSIANGADDSVFATMNDVVGALGKPFYIASLINSKPGFACAGGTGIAETFGSVLTQPLHEFYVFAVTTEENKYLVDGIVGDDDDRPQILTNATGATGFELTAGTAASGGTYATGTPYVLDVEWNGSSSKARKNGSQIVATNLGTGGRAGLTLGAARNGAFPSTLAMCECIIYRGILSTANAAALRATLYAYYGITP